MKAWLALVPLMGLELGCTVTASQADDPRPSNSCSRDSDCGQGFCGQGLCQTPNGTIESLLVTATPPSDSVIAHLTYVAQLTDLPSRKPGDPLVFQGPLKVTGSLSLPANTCYPMFVSSDPEHPILNAPDGVSLPVSITFAPHERVLGLSQQLYYANASKLDDLGGYPFNVLVPSGNYDIYLVPPPNQLACQVPPQLYRNKLIDSKSASALLPLKVLPVSDLALSVHFPDPVDGPGLKGWIADMIEPVGGNAISTAVALGEPAHPKGATNVVYSAPLRYSLVDGDEKSDEATAVSGDLVRLRPPPGVVAPSFLFERAALSLFDPKVADITGFTRYPAAVTVQGQLARHDTGAPISGDVTLVSMSISGVDDGIFPTYQTRVHVEEDGLFHIALPPGQYAVQAVPSLPPVGNPANDATIGALSTVWTVPTDPPVQAGKLLELLPMIELTGQTNFPGAQVQAAAVPPSIPLFDAAFGQNPFTPRATSSLVDDSGRFVVQADPGKFHVSVQPPEFLGYAWFVRPGVQVDDQNLDLGRVAPQIPSLLFGGAQVDDVTKKPLGSASIRAYAYLDKNLAYTRDPKLAVSVIQVAETHADETGAFRLLLPPKLDSK
jgi:hypothetical protein